jgi:hypothetical protein
MNLPRLLRRQLKASEQIPVFALASTVLVGLALASLLVPAQQHAPTRQAREPQATRRPQTSPARPPVVDRDELVAAAREFLTGYLRYLAGGADAQTIPRVSFALRRLLANHRPHRGAGREHRGRILDVRLSAVTAAGAAAVATIVDDSGATFDIHLRLHHNRGGWEVNGLGR